MLKRHYRIFLVKNPEWENPVKLCLEVLMAKRTLGNKSTQSSWLIIDFFIISSILLLQCSTNPKKQWKFIKDLFTPNHWWVNGTVGSFWYCKIYTLILGAPCCVVWIIKIFNIIDNLNNMPFAWGWDWTCHTVVTSRQCEQLIHNMIVEFPTCK